MVKSFNMLKSMRWWLVALGLVVIACAHRIEVPQQADIPNPQIGIVTPGETK